MLKETTPLDPLLPRFGGSVRGLVRGRPPPQAAPGAGAGAQGQGGAAQGEGREALDHDAEVGVPDVVYWHLSVLPSHFLSNPLSGLRPTA